MFLGVSGREVAGICLSRMDTIEDWALWLLFPFKTQYDVKIIATLFFSVNQKHFIYKYASWTGLGKIDDILRNASNLCVYVCVCHSIYLAVLIYFAIVRPIKYH